MKPNIKYSIKTIKLEAYHFYLDQNFVKPTSRLNMQKCYLKSDIDGVYKVTFFNLKPKIRLYEFLVQVKVIDFSFNCLYYFLNNTYQILRMESIKIMPGQFSNESWYSHRFIGMRLHLTKNMRDFFSENFGENECEYFKLRLSKSKKVASHIFFNENGTL